MPSLAATAVANRSHARTLGPPALLLALWSLALTGCASGPKPILYPNDQLQAVGQAEADRAIAECRELADSAGASAGSGDAGRAAGSTAAGGAIGGATGAVGGAILGRPGTGAAVGAATGATAGLLRSIFSGGGQPSPAYRNFVDRCLRERGYEPVGWE
jgi:outer membrane lipoprotein SlyB